MLRLSQGLFLFLQEAHYKENKRMHDKPKEISRAATIRDSLTLAALAVIYLLASIRYFPGQAVRSAVETMSHMLRVAPISLGLTLIIVAILQKLVKERLPLSRAARIFLVSGICLEFALGLSHYFTTSAPG